MIMLKMKIIDNGDDRNMKFRTILGTGHFNLNNEMWQCTKYQQHTIYNVHQTVTISREQYHQTSVPRTTRNVYHSGLYDVKNSTKLSENYIATNALVKK